jgi:hypothetical protein
MSLPTLLWRQAEPVERPPVLRAIPAPDPAGVLTRIWMQVELDQEVRQRTVKRKQLAQGSVKRPTAAPSRPEGHAATVQFAYD